MGAMTNQEWRAQLSFSVRDSMGKAEYRQTRWLVCSQLLDITLHPAWSSLGPIRGLVHAVRSCWCQCSWKAFREEILRQPNGHEVLVKGRPDNQGVGWISDQIKDLLKVTSCLFSDTLPWLADIVGNLCCASI